MNSDPLRRSMRRRDSIRRDVDEMVERREPQGQHRHEALTAGDHLGFVAQLGEEGDGLLRGLGRW